MKHDARNGGPGDLQYDNAFWRFSLAVYGEEGVAQECLALQEAFGLDVNVLLFCAWCGTRAIALNRTEIDAACGAVAAWHDHVVRPLRGVRQYVKTLQRDDFENFRTKVKGIELEAEQIEQAILFAHSQRVQGANAPDAVARNVGDYIAINSGNMSAPHLIAAAARFKQA